MALKRTDNKAYTGLQAPTALAMALFEQTGLRELIDSKFSIDARLKLTPGNAVKALLGNMMGTMRKNSLYNVANPYLSAPVDLLFGEKVDMPALGGRAFSRNLDRLFRKDLPVLTYECYSRLAEFYGLTSNVFNIDSTNFTINAVGKDADIEGAAVPEWCGHAKDGRDDKLVYSLLSVTDENSVLCYECPNDGATADSVMDRGAMEFLSGKVDPRESTLIADCKIATGPLIDLICEKGFGFVAKCPDNFGQRARSSIVYSVKNGIMDPSLVRDGWEIYDTDMDINGRMLRFIAFRTTDDIVAGIEYLREQGLKEAGAIFNRFQSRLYNCEIDAKRALDEALVILGESAYGVKWSIDAVEISDRYGHRGRPKNGSKPTTHTEYRVNIELVFDEERAKALSQDRGVRVLVTNLPRSAKDKENIRFGATADTVLPSYLGQYRIEHAFRLMKDGMHMSRVYIHRPSRENAMMFVISLATMITGVMDHVLKEKGCNITTTGISDKFMTLILEHDRDTDSESFRGPADLADEYLGYVEALGIDPDHLIH